MNDITIFTYENTNIRTVTTEDGEPWFVAKDVCGILELAHTHTPPFVFSTKTKRGCILCTPPQETRK